MRKNSVKNIRINEEVHRELAEILRNDVKDPRIAPMVSITEVEVAPDLKTAKVYVSVLGDDEAAARTMDGIKSSAGYIRHLLAERLNLRYTPVLNFHLDTSIAYAINMSKKIEEVKAADAAAGHKEDEQE